MISAGQSHSAALDHKGTVFTWGLNDVGQLGDQTTMSRTLPNPIYSMDDDSPVSQLTCGQNHNLILRSNGKLYAWGSNSSGQLGNGSKMNSKIPVPVDMSGVLNGTVITQMAAGAFHSLVLTNDGSMFAWGDNYDSQLGDGTVTIALVPVAVDMSALSGRVVIHIAASKYHSVALTSDGTVYYWGDKGLLDEKPTGSLTPVAVDMSGVLQGSTIVQIAVGYLHTVMLTNDSKIYAFGSNQYGQLGNHSYTNSLLPIPVEMHGELSGKLVVQIAAGGYHTLALTSDNLLYGWGKATEGQLGDQSNNLSYPTYLHVNDKLNDSITQIVGGESHTMILTSKGKSYSMGKNEDAQLGDGTKGDQSKPIPIGMNGALYGKTITNIVTRTISWGTDHYVALTQDGNVYSWGKNGAGEIGDGTTISKQFPVMSDKSGIMNEKIITQVTVGNSFTVAKTEDGTLYSWGENGNGQIGDGSLQERHVPVAVFMGGVLNNKTITTVSSGLSHVVAVANDGMVYSWGWNIGGVLGDGTTQKKKSPVSVVKGDMEGKRIVQIAASTVHTVALASDGKLFAWGMNKCGILKMSTRNDFTTVPTYIEIDGTVLEHKNITHLTAGYDHTTVLTSDGQIYSWGLTDFGIPRSFDHLPVQLSMNGLLNGKIVSQLAVNDVSMLSFTNDRMLGYWNFKLNYSTWINMDSVDTEQGITSLFVAIDTMGFLGVTCEQGYFGNDCDLFNCYDIDSKNQERVCSGHGICVDLNTCKCTEGYTGMNCSHHLCHGYSSIDKKVCSSHGTCQGPNKCVCEHGYHGDTCSSNLRPLWTLLALGVVMCLCLIITIIVVAFQIRRKRKEEQMKSELRAYLLEEMSDYGDMPIEKGDFFIDMRDIKLISRISEGAFGVVFKGEWKSNCVAVKKMKVSDDESFVREVSILQSLRHPNILYLYGYSSNDTGDKFLITEYAVNGSLDKILYGNNVTLKPFDQKMNILCQIADTMAYLHGRSPRIVHRDLKPQNILLSESYHVRVCDFGLSKITDTSFTQGKSYGTIEYCAPELLAHQTHDEKCDVYSFGIIMHEIFTLAAPYSQHEYLSVFTLGVDILRGLRPSIPPSNDSQAMLHFFSQSNTTNIPLSDIPSIVQDFYSLATRCWDTDTTKRPSFEQITTELDAIKKRSE